MKNNIRKIISLFLVLAMIISVSGTVFATETDNSAGDESYNNTLEFLKTLKIIEDYDNFVDTKPITRGYFAMVAARLYNIPFDGMAKEPRFTDVPMYSSYVDAIELLANMGAISGNGTGEFHENERIKIIDAAKILTVVSGYDFIAEINGGYPKGYITAANAAGLLKGIGSVDDYLTATGMLVMVANMLDADDLDITLGKNGKTYTKNSEKNYLKKTFDVDIVEGIVTQNSLTAFDTVSDLKDNELEIEDNKGQKHVLYSEEYGKYIGMRVKAFYKNDLKNDKIIYAYPLSGRNNVTKMQLSDIYLATSSVSEIKYYDRDKKQDKTAKSSTGTPKVIYNNVYYDVASTTATTVAGNIDFNGADMVGKKGTVELIDNDGDNKHDIIIINAYDSFIVGNVLIDEKKVHSSSNAYGTDTIVYPGGVRTDVYQTIDINPDNYDYFSMKFDDGTDVDIIDIVEKQIMSVAQSVSSGKKAIEIIITSNIQSGKITALEEDRVSPKYYVTIDSREPFETTIDVVNEFDLHIGKSVSLYIDALGNVVGATIVPTGYYRYGVMLDYKLRKDVLWIKIFTADNEVQEYELAEKSFIDGVKYKVSLDAKTRLDAVKTYIKSSQNISIDGDAILEGVYPIRYLINDSGKMYKIDTPSSDANSEDEGLVIDLNGNFAVTYDNILIEYNKDNPKTVPMSKEATVIWMALSGETKATSGYSYNNARYDETSLEIGDTSSFSGLSEKECYTYRIKDETHPNSPYVDLILSVSKNNSIEQETGFFMVDKITHVYDEEEEEVLPVLTGISGGAQKSVVVSSTLKSDFSALNLQRGDTVRIAVNSHTGYMEAISDVSRYGVSGTTGLPIATITAPYSNTKVNATQQKRWVYIGYVAERRGELLRILRSGGGEFALTPDTAAITGTDNMVYANASSSTNVTVYDRRQDKVYAGTFDDIKDYIHYGFEASRVIVRYDSGSLKEVAVYND